MIKQSRVILAHIFFVIAVIGIAAKAQAVGDPSAGKSKVSACVTCHAEDGNSVVPQYPRLAGQGEKYLLRQLRAIKNGDYPVPLMAGQLDNFSDQDLKDIAAWYASNQPEVDAADPELAQAGEQIYRFGIASRGIPACTACHSPTGQGNYPAGYPRLAGQHAEYVLQRLLGYRDGIGSYDDVSAIMADIALGMNRAEMEAVASYIQGLRSK